MKERGEKFIPEELEEEGFIPVQSESIDLSDKNRQTDSLEGEIALEEIINKAHLNKRENNILSARYIDGKSYEEIAAGTKSELNKKRGVTRERVQQIEATALRKARPLLPKNLQNEIVSWKERNFAKRIVEEYFYPQHKNRFLMVEYLVKYLSHIELSNDEQVILHAINRDIPKEKLMEEVRGMLSLGRGGQVRREYSQEEVDDLVNSFLKKIRRVIEQKFR